MSKLNKQIYKNIRFGKNIHESLAEYIETLRGLYKSFSELNLSMHYFMFYENYIDSYHKMHARELDLLASLNELINKSFFIGPNKEDHNYSNISSGTLIEDLDDIRQEITSRMKILTNYTDILLIYDYILKRIEYRFSSYLEDIDDEQVSKQIFNYIFDSEDQGLINNKISDVVSYLPVRMSRFKYFDLISESFNLFKDMTQDSMESYLYMIRSSAMLYTLDGMSEVFPELNSTKVELETCNYQDIDQDEWTKLSSKLDDTTDTINYLADYYYSLQEIVNQLYIYLLNAKESNQDIYEEKLRGPMISIIRVINQSLSDNTLELADETQNLLSKTEGLQEELIGHISNMESVFSIIEDKYSNIVEKLGLNQSLASLKKSQLFFSNSLFFELDKVEDSRTLTEEEVKKERERLLSDLEDLFVKNSRYVNRAIMANTLNKIPGFLTNPDEVFQYISSSLSQCRDIAEKKASVNIIKSFWE